MALGAKNICLTMSPISCTMVFYDIIFSIFQSQPIKHFNPHLLLILQKRRPWHSIINGLISIFFESYLMWGWPFQSHKNVVFFIMYFFSIIQYSYYWYIWYTHIGAEFIYLFMILNQINFTNIFSKSETTHIPNQVCLSNLCDKLLDFIFPENENEPDTSFYKCGSRFIG